MEQYTVKKFIKLLKDDIDIVFGTCSLNAATRVESRIRKKHLIEALSQVTNDEFGVYAQIYTDHKGRTIAKLV